MHDFSVILGILDCIKCRSCKKYFIAEAAALSVPAWSVHVLLVSGVQWKSNAACISLWSTNTQQHRCALLVFILVNTIHNWNFRKCKHIQKDPRKQKQAAVDSFTYVCLCCLQLSDQLSVSGEQGISVSNTHSVYPVFYGSWLVAGCYVLERGNLSFRAETLRYSCENRSSPGFPQGQLMDSWDLSLWISSS